MSDLTLNLFMSMGPDADMLAHTPDPPPTPLGQPDFLQVWFNTDDSTLYYWDGANYASFGGSGTVTNTGALTDHGVVVGNGGTDISALAPGANGEVLRGSTGADPAFGPLVETDLAGFTDLTTGDASSTKHGLQPKSPADATKFLNGAATPAYAAVKDSDLSTTDITTNDVSSTKHGFAPKSPADATKFLNGAATPAFAAVKDSDLSLSDIATNNASTSNHGFLKKLSNNASEYMDGTGNWSTVTSTPPSLKILQAERFI